MGFEFGLHGRIINHTARMTVLSPPDLLSDYTVLDNNEATYSGGHRDMGV